MAVGQNPVPLVNRKIGGTWVFIDPPQNGGIGSDPWPNANSIGSPFDGRHVGWDLCPPTTFDLVHYQTSLPNKQLLFPPEHKMSITRCRQV